VLQTRALPGAKGLRYNKVTIELLNDEDDVSEDDQGREAARDVAA
jgi:hypothetical protein